MKITRDTWITSDHHFGHENIIKFEPVRKEILGEDWERPLINLHNALVKPSDHVLFLGDFSFRDPLSYSSRLNGRKELILGNHDRKGFQPYKDFEHVYKGVTVDWNGRLFTHRTDDELLSALIQEVDGVMCGFCHYTPGYHDQYDDQRESAKVIKERKEILDELFESFGVEVVFHGHLHSKLAVSPRYDYRNVCLEHHGMQPVRVGDLLR